MITKLVLQNFAIEGFHHARKVVKTNIEIISYYIVTLLCLIIGLVHFPILGENFPKLHM